MDGILTPENIIIALGSIGAFLTIVAFGLPMLGNDNLKSRLKTVAARREELSAAARQKFTTQNSSLRQQSGRSYVTFLVDKFKRQECVNRKGSVGNLFYPSNQLVVKLPE